MKARVKWVQDMSFIGEADSGHALVMDAAPEVGGRNLGPRPMELLLLGMGGCTGIDVVSILKKARQPIVDCVVELEAARAPTDPKIFTRVHLHYVITGRGLNETHVKRAVELSSEKYCSASIMIGKVAEVTHDYEIIEAA